MTLPAASTDEPFESPPENHESFRPIDRTELSESALSLLDRYRIENANDPMAIFITIVDTMNARQREAISHFEAAIALAGVEFGRIDLALEKAEETQKRVETLANVLERLQKDCILVTSQTREPSKFVLGLDRLRPFIYSFLGATITLLVAIIVLRLKIL